MPPIWPCIAGPPRMRPSSLLLPMVVSAAAAAASCVAGGQRTLCDATLQRTAARSQADHRLPCKTEGSRRLASAQI